MQASPSPADHDATIARWKSPDHTPRTRPADARAVGDPGAAAHPAGDVHVDAVSGADGMPTTGWACATLVSTGLSCGPCDTTLWKGTCGVSTIGCCKEPE
jgi:hypothetical protein